MKKSDILPPGIADKNDSLLVSAFKTHLHFSIPDYLSIKTHFQFYTRKKKDFLLREGQTSSDYFFILEGYVRTFYSTESGEEVTIDILRKGEFASSMYSILKQAPSFESIQCVTDCNICKISAASFETLAIKNPEWIQLGMKCLQSALLKKEERILTFGKLKGKARYAKLMAERPDIIQHVPVQYIASYLGMKPESLSRIKN
ncbi:Crp/Fnr family transcriptional regulator [Chitinophaga nivalis]|uniref:Crp/Fnr family transcriptional regulator n=1 Tax=Chitinophaga nivalis TaxID=2991709 RepID=A0ABT3IT42_9BACT|nr:Crp/Fnr family transcriptional regulator [Chitinophaga nivalis]MCW3463163.1 Crp/Fnr family transcriptional regulator [Chitinophaga nivalis]MCW3487147.1 Crp/Fnr family transcriptional regulator [Chitinophaga nivalis]